MKSQTENEMHRVHRNNTENRSESAWMENERKNQSDHEVVANMIFEEPVH